MSQRKHPDRRHGHRTAAENAHDTIPAGDALAWPDPDPEWCAPAVRLYDGLRTSGQVRDFQPSDVAVSWMICDQVARHYAYPGPMGATAIMAIMSGLNDLLATAGSRRRVKLELEQGNDVQEAAQDAAVMSLVGRARPGGDDDLA